MRRIFADTLYWIAITHPKDQWHRVAVEASQTFIAGVALYESRLDKGYSLTDCISMVAMRWEGITEILTRDSHFSQEGFRILL
jgi:predicted nucleic acid-binding protein